MILQALRALAASMVALAAPAGGALADALELEGRPPGAWRFSAMAYSFLPVSTDGVSTVAGASADVDLSLGDVLDNLDLAAAGRLEAWRGDFGAVLDLYYTRLSPEGAAVGPNGGRLSVDVVSRQTILDLAGAWRFREGVYGAQGRRFALDAQAGLRFNSLEQSIHARVDLLDQPGRQASLGGTETWWEPLLGLRAAVQVAERTVLTARADLSGFGISDNDLAYRLVATVDWRATERVWLTSGWMLYGIDYATDRGGRRFAYDVVQTGPFLGLRVDF